MSTCFKIPRRRQFGIGLIEVMVASAIAGVLIVGAVTVYSDSRATYTTHETSSRLEESGRYVLSVIEPDVRMASYWGLLQGPLYLSGASSQTAVAATALAGSSASVCGTNYSVDLTTSLEGSNDGYTLGCQALNNRPMPSADTLTVRRSSYTASTVPATTTGALRVCSQRLSAALVKLVNGSASCPPPPFGLVGDMIVHAYYVDQDSSTTANLPTLFRKSLNSTPTFVDEEILQGVEDLQVQFGIDPLGNTGIVTQYIDPLTAANLPVDAQVISVRIWVLLRADSQEQGFTDNRTYAYANRQIANGVVASLTAGGAAGKAYRPADKYRRLLVSRTIMIRNALGT